MSSTSSPPNGHVTPKSYVTVGHHMLRLRTWELTHEQVLEAVKPFILDGGYSLVVRTEKDHRPIGYSALLLEKESDMDRIRANPLTVKIMSRKGEVLTTTIPKIQKYSRNPGQCNFTIKTTAPLWANRAMIEDIFNKYSNDKELHTLVIEGKIVENQRYPLIRFKPTNVMREDPKTGVKVKTTVNVIYIEYSPKPGCEDDALVAQSMQYRTYVTNPHDPMEVASLIFKPWTFDKIQAEMDSKDRQTLHEERIRQQEMKISGIRSTVDVLKGQLLPAFDAKVAAEPELFIIPSR